MSESANRATLEALVAALNASDLEGLDRVFTDDVVMEWPQSGERIVGGQNRREVYSRFPSLPQVTPRRMTGSADLWVVEASLPYLVVAGGDLDPDYEQWLHRMLPQATVAVWPGSGHFPHLAHPKSFAACLAAAAHWPVDALSDAQ